MSAMALTAATSSLELALPAREGLDPMQARTLIASASRQRVGNGHVARDSRLCRASRRQYFT
jgi:hypothetical protein